MTLENVHENRLEAISSNKTNAIVACVIVGELIDEYNANSEVTTDACHIMETMPLKTLLTISVDEIAFKLRYMYTSNIFESYARRGEMDFLNYDRTKDDEVNKLTSEAIDFTEGLSLNQLEILTRHKEQMTDDFELAREEDDF